MMIKHLAGKHDQQDHGRERSNTIDETYDEATTKLLMDDIAQKFDFVGGKKNVTLSDGDKAEFILAGVEPRFSLYGDRAPSPHYNFVLTMKGRRFRAGAFEEQMRDNKHAWYFTSKLTKRYGVPYRTPEALAEGLVPLIAKHLPGQHDQTTHGRPGDPVQGVIPQRPTTPLFDKQKWESVSIPDRKKAWNAMTPEQQDAIADATHSILNTQNQLLAFAGMRPQTGTPMEAVTQRLKDIGDLMMPDAHQKVLSNMNELAGHLKESGVADDAARHIMLEAVDALAAQESESMGRQLGDHGVRHVLGDAEMALQILDTLPGTDSPQAKAAVRLAAIFHDAGYMTEPSKAFLDDQHPRWGGQHYEANIRPMIEKALGSETADHISYMIDTHAGTFLDWDNDPVSSALRVADNAALFHKEKLPGVFKYVPENVAVLEAVGQKTISIEEGRKQVIDNIGKSQLPEKVKAALYRAGNEMNLSTPKFTLGMMGGEISSFSWLNGALNVFIKRSPEAKRLQNVLDLGQRQFSKWAEAFGVDPKAFGTSDRFDFNYRGKTYLRTYVTGASLKSTAVVEKSLPIDDFLETTEFIEEPIDWSNLEDEPIEKAGTSLGARLGWERRQIARKRRKEDIRRGWAKQKQSLEIQLDEAVQSRNAKQANGIRARIRSGDRVYATVKSLVSLLERN